MPESRKGSIEHVEVGDRRESKESLSTGTSSFTASRRMSLESAPLERSVMVSSCGLIFMGPARAGGEGRHNRGSVWLEVEERLQRRGGSKATAERLSPAFLGARSFPALWSNSCSSPCSSQLPQRHSAADGESSSRMRSHSMYLSTPKACDAMPRSPQQRAKDSDERWKEPRSFDVLLRMANQKFRQMNELLHEDSQPQASEEASETMLEMREVPNVHEDEDRSLARPQAKQVRCLPLLLALRLGSQLCSWTWKICKGT